MNNWGMKTNRREFLGASGAAVVGAASFAASQKKVLGANDRLRIGVIGCGGMGTGHIGHFVRNDGAFAQMVNAEITAVCDIYEPRKQRAQELSGGKVFHDYRELIHSGLVDAVIIASPEHWHYKQALESIQAGLDVYLQKPATRSFAEIKSLRDEISKTDRVFQLGSQYMQTPAWYRAKELFQEKMLGKVTLCQTSYCRNSRDGEWNYKIDDGVEPGKNLDWNAFLGPLTYVEYNPEYYFRWRKYEHFSGGIITDLLPHKIHTISYVIGPELPRYVSAVGGIYVHNDRDVADTIAVTIGFENYTMVVAGSTCNEIGLEDLVRGHHGNLYVGGNSVRLIPERTYADDFDAIEERVEPAQMNGHLVHVKEWIEGIRERKQPTWNIDATYKVMTAIAMAEQAYVEKRTVRFDPVTEQVV